MDKLLLKMRDSVHLRDHEKALLKRAILEHIHATTTMRSSMGTVAAGHIFSSWLLVEQLHARRALPFLVAALLFVGAGVSFAAERALPGDFLYPIKLEVNEPLQSLAALTPQAQAMFAANIVSRRLLEMEQLALKGHLTPVYERQLTEAATQNIQAVNNVRVRLTLAHREAESRQVSLHLASVLAVHRDLLEATLRAVPRDLDQLTQVSMMATLPRIDRRAFVGAATGSSSSADVRSVTPSPHEPREEVTSREALITAERAAQVIQSAQSRLETQLRVRVLDVSSSTTQTALATRIQTDAQTHLQAARQALQQGEAALSRNPPAALPILEEAEQAGEQSKMLLEANGVLREDVSTATTSATRSLPLPQTWLHEDNKLKLHP